MFFNWFSSSFMLYGIALNWQGLTGVFWCNDAKKSIANPIQHILFPVQGTLFVSFLIAAILDVPGKLLALVACVRTIFSWWWFKAFHPLDLDGPKVPLYWPQLCCRSLLHHQLFPSKVLFWNPVQDLVPPLVWILRQISSHTQFRLIQGRRCWQDACCGHLHDQQVWSLIFDLFSLILIIKIISPPAFDRKLFVFSLNIKIPSLPAFAYQPLSPCSGCGPLSWCQPTSGEISKFL